MSRLFGNKLRIVWVILLILVISVLLYLAILPFGNTVYTFNSSNNGSFWEKLTPSSRLELSNKIIGNPVYINLRTSRPFNDALLTMKYKLSENNNQLPSIIEVGSLVDSKLWKYNLKPIHNQVLNTLKDQWNVVQDGELILFDRLGDYDSLEGFFSGLPSLDEIAVYNYDLDADYKLVDYEASSNVVDLDYQLKGAYSFYFYLNEKENLYFDFLVKNLKSDKDIDSVSIFLYYKNEIIDFRVLNEDEFILDDNQSINLSLASMPEGVYKIEVKAGDDIITDRISTTQKKLSFINRIWLNESSNESINIFTDSRQVSFNTTNPSSLQVIQVGSEEIRLSETYRQYGSGQLSGVNEIKLQKDDLIIAGDGVFSFSEESLINPSLKKVNKNFDINNTLVNYIIARYSFPEQENDWKTAVVNFDLSHSYRENQRYNFIISVPGLKTDDKINDWVEIEEIKVELAGVNIRDWFKNKFE